MFCVQFDTSEPNKNAEAAEASKTWVCRILVSLPPTAKKWLFYLACRQILGVQLHTLYTRLRHPWMVFNQEFEFTS